MAESLRHKIRSDIAPFLIGMAAKQLPEDGDLISLGLDSLAMMKLAAMWRKQGYLVTFASLISTPKLMHWEALLNKQQNINKQQISEAVTVLPCSHNAQKPFPLAMMQHAYWVGRDTSQHLGGVAAHFYHEFDCDDIDPLKLKHAVRALFTRHDMLRVKIIDDGSQQILPQPYWSDLTVYDLRTMDATDGSQQLDVIRNRLSHRQLAIEKGEVFDVRLSYKPASCGGGCRLHFNLDMIAADAMSLRILLDDLAQLYLAPQQPLPILTLGYADYQQQHQALLIQPERSAQREQDRLWWLNQLGTLPGAPVLPKTIHNAKERTCVQQVVRRHYWLNMSDRQQLEEKARQYQLTPAMLIATAFAEIISQFSDEEDFILNLPLFNREFLHPDVLSLVGDFTSSILLAWQGTAPGSFLERASRLQQQFHANAAHASYSGIEVLRDASRLHGQQQFAPVVFTSALGLGELFSERVREAFGESGWIISQGPQVWLDSQVTEFNQGLLINWDARESHFPAGMLDLMFNSFIQLLTKLIQDDTCWQNPVPDMLSQKQKQIRQQANATEAPLPAARLHDAFFALAKYQPEAPALLWQFDRQMSYGELARRAQQLAAQLMSEGIAEGHLVAILLPKGPEQIIAVLAVLVTGAAWLPLNYQHPKRRRDAILVSAGVTKVIDILPIDDGTSPSIAINDRLHDNRQLAYVIYTSGSTGEPKGVEVSHLAALNTLADLNRRYPLGRQMRTLAVSALSFDLSVYDIFAPLSVGGAIVCIDDGSWRNAHHWVALILEHQVTVLNCVPAIAEMILTATSEKQTLPLQLMLLGGDWVPLGLIDKLRSVTHACKCVALGGTTETAIHSTVQEITQIPASWCSIPYGFPLDNVQCRVVDSQGRDRCDWVSGELWIGGAGVALGYRHDSERSAARFVTVEGSRWYRTGDLARYHPDGVLEFLGRRDHQVKIHGYRIELGEIESALIAHPGIDRGIALLSANKRLVAAYTVTEEDVSAAALRTHLQYCLPPEMIPEQLLQLPALPLSSNGKIDRAQLSQQLAACRESQPASSDAALEGTETQVAEVWRQVLGLLPRRNDDFFTLGGDSLLATRVIVQLRQIGFTTVTLSQLLTQPTLSSFCRSLLFSATAGQPPEALTSDIALRHNAAERYQPFPLTDIQQSYLYGRQRDVVLGGIGCYFYREFTIEDLDVPRLEHALNQLIIRHDMLRAVFRHGQQQILESVPVYRIQQQRGDSEAIFDHQRVKTSVQNFDPTQWPLFCVTVATCGRHSRVAIGIDNLILDALSILIFYQELGAAYAQSPLFEPPSIQFRDALQNGRPDTAEQAAAWHWWQSRLAEIPLAPQLPLACSPASIRASAPQTNTFTRRQHAIAAEDWQQLVAQTRHWGITPSAVMLAAFAEVLRRWSKQSDFTLNLTLFDRPESHPDITRVLGDFTSLVLVPCRSDKPNWLERVREVQRELWDALDHRQVSTVAILRELARLHDEPELVMPVVFTSALGLNHTEDNGLFSRPVWGISQTPQVWLDHQLTEHDGGVLLVWDAVEALFPLGVLNAMFNAYQQLLNHLCHQSWQQPLPELMPSGQQMLREQITRAAQHSFTEYFSTKDSSIEPKETLHHAFFAHAALQPTASALFWQQGEQQKKLDYGALADAALRLAHWLQRQGVQVGDKVAISLPKGPQQVVAVLGILAAGAAYVPIGLDQPATRRAALCRQAQVRMVLSTETPLLGAKQVQAQTAPLLAPVAMLPSVLAYVIFTSGSTGEPKGVKISHRAASNTLNDICQRINLEPQDRLLALSALDFDLSVFDLFAPLSRGAALVLVDEAYRRDAAHWLALIHQYNISIWNSVPALLEMLLAAADGQQSLSLRAALISGDWINLNLPERLTQFAPASRFWALGGATEAAIWSNIFPVEQVAAHWRSIPYGYPLANQCWRVVNAQGEDCPDWVEGELWIGGAGLAEGYLEDEEKSHTAFPQIVDQRWYRTGDRGRYWPDGTLEFLGRLDNQIKLRGHRIEAGEVENALCQQSGVGQAAVSLWHDGVVHHLMAAIVPKIYATHSKITTITQSDISLHQSQEWEARAVEQILAGWLSLPQLIYQQLTYQQTASQQIWVPKHTLVLNEHGSQVLTMWLNWLVERQILAVIADGFCAGTRRITAMPLPEKWQVLVNHALAQRTQWLAMLAGDISIEFLLDDPLLAPASLSANDAITQTWLSQLATDITQQATILGRPVRLAELNAASGQHAQYLLRHLKPGTVDYILLESMPQALIAAKQHLVECEHSLEFCLINPMYLPDKLLASCDRVLAINALHRITPAAAGMMVARQLLNKGGQFHLLERHSLTPLAMLTAGLLTGNVGIIGDDDVIDDDIIGSGGTGTDVIGAGALMPGMFWARLAQQCGMTKVALVHTGLADIVTAYYSFAEQLPPERLTLLREMLPSAMVPERLLMLTHLPLTANGKVDRKRLQKIYDTLPRQSHKNEDLNNHEKKLAELWAELLAQPCKGIGRRQGFFELGGDSLQATRLLKRIYETFGVTLPLRQIFNAPALRDMAENIYQRQQQEKLQQGNMEGGTL